MPSFISSQTVPFPCFAYIIQQTDVTLTASNVADAGLVEAGHPHPLCGSYRQVESIYPAYHLSGKQHIDLFADADIADSMGDGSVSIFQWLG